MEPPSLASISRIVCMQALLQENTHRKTECEDEDKNTKPECEFRGAETRTDATLCDTVDSLSDKFDQDESSVDLENSEIHIKLVEIDESEASCNGQKEQRSSKLPDEDKDLDETLPKDETFPEVCKEVLQEQPCDIEMVLSGNEEHCYVDGSNTDLKSACNVYHMDKECMDVMNALEQDKYKSRRNNFYLTRLLETGCFTAVSEDILNRIVRYCPNKLNNRLLKALIPPCAKELNLHDCGDIGLMAMVDIFAKCRHLQRLNLMSCPQVIHPDVFTVVRLYCIPLTTLILEENANVTDEVVHSAIKNLRHLTTLNVSTCSNMSNNVFLVFEEEQLSREVDCRPYKDTKYCSLTNVDISGCRALETVCVQHLVSLAGPSLQHVNLSWTSVDFMALLYLGGYSTPHIINFLFSDHAIKSDRELEPVLQKYSDLRDAYIEVIIDEKVKEATEELDASNEGVNNVLEVSEEDTEDPNKDSKDSNTVCDAAGDDDHSDPYLTFEIDTDPWDIDEILEVEAANKVNEEEFDCESTEGDEGLYDTEIEDIGPESEIVGHLSTEHNNESRDVEESDKNTVAQEIENRKSNVTDETANEYKSTGKLLDGSASSQNCRGTSKETDEHSVSTDVDKIELTVTDEHQGSISDSGIFDGEESVLINCGRSTQDDVDELTTDVKFNNTTDTVIYGNIANEPSDIGSIENNFDTVNEPSANSLNKDHQSEKRNPLGGDIQEDELVTDVQEEGVCQTTEPCERFEELPDEYPSEKLVQQGKPDMEILQKCDRLIDEKSDTTIDKSVLNDDKSDSIDDISDSSDTDSDTFMEAKEECEFDWEIETDNMEESIPGECEVTLDHFDTDTYLEIDNNKNNMFSKSTRTAIVKLQDSSKTTTSSDEGSESSFEDHKLLAFEYSENLFRPQIESLNITGTKCRSKKHQLGQMCLKKFVQVNPNLQRLSLSWKGLTMSYFQNLVQYLPEMTDIELYECTMIQSPGVQALGRNCRKLQKVNLRGVVFISDFALVPFLSMENLTTLILAESDHITDRIVTLMASRLPSTLTHLDISWCEELTEKGVNAICEKCANLKVLILKKCPVSDMTMQLLGETATDLEELYVESTDSNDIEIFTDAGGIIIAENLKNLRILDISWNLAIRDASIGAILKNCIQLQEAYLKGLKRITIEPFLPMIMGQESTETHHFPSDELPERSALYAPNLRVLDLDYSDLVSDQMLQRLVNVCRGTLNVTDYYGTLLEPEKTKESKKTDCLIVGNEPIVS